MIMLRPARESSIPERTAFSTDKRKSWATLLVRSTAPVKSFEGMADVRDFVSAGSIKAESSDTNLAVVGSKSSGIVKFSAPIRICDESSIALTEGEDLLRIRIGTRSSPLALAQVKVIADMIRASWPDAEIIPVPIKTSGDKNMAAFSSDPQGIKGMFTHEIEESLRRGEIDIAVHSLKDLPANIAPDLPIVAYSKRGDPRDALIGGFGVIGTSSARRRVQLAGLYPDAKIVPVRGNIGTRLKKLDAGEYSGLVLSAAGLERLGLSQRIARIFTVDEIVPSPGQGILACQGRSDSDYPYLECVNDEDARDCAVAERSFSRCLGSGCNIPAGAYAEVDGEHLTLRGFFADDGRIKRVMLSGKRREAESMGMKLAEVVLS